jgi:hypothetical protein
MKMKTQILKSIFDTIKSILIFGFSWFAIGYFGPLIIKPGANLGPLLGITVTGPVGIVLGGIFGIISTFIDTKNKINPSNKFRLFPKIWNRILWSSAGLAVLVIVSTATPRKKFEEVVKYKK